MCGSSFHLAFVGIFSEPIPSSFLSLKQSALCRESFEYLLCPNPGVSALWGLAGEVGSWTSWSLEFEEQENGEVGDTRGAKTGIGRPKAHIIYPCPDSIGRGLEAAIKVWYPGLFCQSPWKEQSPGAFESRLGHSAIGYWCLAHSAHPRGWGITPSWPTSVHLCVTERNLAHHHRALACLQSLEKMLELRGHVREVWNSDVLPGPTFSWGYQAPRRQEENKHWLQEDVYRHLLWQSLDFVEWSQLLRATCSDTRDKWRSVFLACDLLLPQKCREVGKLFGHLETC